MNLKSLLIVACIFFSISSCNDKEEENEEIVEAVDPLITTGLIHQWLLDSRVVNDVTDMAIECCDYITFSTDSIDDDLVGNFYANGFAYETNGTFSVNTDDSVITFSFQESEVLYYFEVNNNQLLFRYNTDSQNVDEVWLKQ
ncbi:copper resistance protein NlpE [Flavobacteriales bacterium]|nr:copper resistance protein NlpE [Flavobacteriales bacterium]